MESYKFNQLTDLIHECDNTDLENIRYLIFPDEKNESNIYDDLKNRLINVALEKYSLEELEIKLDIKNY